MPFQRQNLSLMVTIIKKIKFLVKLDSGVHTTIRNCDSKMVSLGNDS